MADGLSSIKRKPLVSPTTAAQNKPNPSKFYSNFLFRALVATVFFVVVPMLPSIAPDFFGGSLFTQSWELLHMILVGIAVSYGLFSRRYDDSGRVSNSKFDNAQSYVSKLLHVTYVFDEEVDSSSGSCDDGGSKVQAWSSRYYRNEPTIVVLSKKGDPGASGDERKTHLNSSVIEDNKPLLLPIRSLNSRVSDENCGDGYGRSFTRSSSSSASISHSKERSSRSKKYRNVAAKSRVSDVDDYVGCVSGDGGVPRSFSRSISSSSSNSTDSSEGRNGLFGGGFNEGSYKVRVEDESVVLPSPVPWRSRSGRMEMKEVDNTSLSPSMEKMEPDQLLRFQTSRISRSSSESSPIKLSSSTSSSSSSSSSSSTPTSNSPNKLPPPSASSLESQAKRTEDLVRRRSVYKSSPPPPPPPPPSAHLPEPTLGKLNSCLANDEASAWKDSDETDRLVGRADSGELEAPERSKLESPSLGIGKSVRTIRAGESAAMGRRARDVVAEERSAGKLVRRSKEDVETTMTEKPNGLLNESTSAGSSKTSWSDYAKETKDFLEQVVVATDDGDADNDSKIDENYGAKVQSVENENGNSGPSSNGMADDGPDVDKKADEFIAKFREQIRLQRIESIKRSSGQLRRNN